VGTSDGILFVCHRCGATKIATQETVPYVGPGARVVDLTHVQVFRCVQCEQMSIEVPEPRALDVLIRCLENEMVGPLPQLAYEMGRWCILPRRSGAPQSDANRTGF
jgi:hypothetical protein